MLPESLHQLSVLSGAPFEFCVDCRHILLIQILRTNSNCNFRKGIVSKRRIGLFKCFLGASNSCHCSQVIPDAFALSSKTSFIVLVSGMPCGRRPTTRMP